jgi:anti-sigma-K factor RskA
MNLLRPELLEALARDYALGTMSGGARRRFERLQREHVTAQQAVAAWSGRLAHLAKPVPPLRPRPAVWNGLQQRLFPEAEPPAQRRPWWQKLFGSQAWAGALAGTMLCVIVLRQQPDWAGLETRSEALPATYVGLLLDSGGKPAVLASSRRQGRQITIKFLQALAVPAGQVAQLWGLTKDGVPFPVGIVPPSDRPGVSVTLPLPDTAEKLFFGTSRLAVSLEPASAKPDDKPTGEFVLSGHCVKLW